MIWCLYGILDVYLKDKFGILHVKPCFKIISDEIERLRLKIHWFDKNYNKTCWKAFFAAIFV